MCHCLTIQSSFSFRNVSSSSQPRKTCTPCPKMSPKCTVATPISLSYYTHRYLHRNYLHRNLATVNQPQGLSESGANKRAFAQRQKTSKRIIHKESEHKHGINKDVCVTCGSCGGLTEHTRGKLRISGWCLCDARNREEEGEAVVVESCYEDRDFCCNIHTPLLLIRMSVSSVLSWISAWTHILLLLVKDRQRSTDSFKLSGSVLSAHMEASAAFHIITTGVVQSKTIYVI